MSKTKDRMRENALRYKQSLGQNFIYDENLLAALAESAAFTAEDDVLEIGPGSGTLTQELCKRAHHVLSVELDERLIPLLSAYMEPYSNFTLVQGDVMKLNLPEVTKELKKPLHVVANIPYYITTPLLQMLLASPLDIASICVMIQKEVADKLMAAPGTDSWCPLSIHAQYRCDVEVLMDVPAACFTPPPKVDSAFVALRMKETKDVQVKNEEDFFRVVACAFALRRKTMVNNLCATFRMERAQALSLMEKAGLEATVRGEKLTIEELARLADAYTEGKEQA